MNAGKLCKWIRKELNARQDVWEVGALRLEHQETPVSVRLLVGCCGRLRLQVYVNGYPVRFGPLRRWLIRRAANRYVIRFAMRRT